MAAQPNPLATGRPVYVVDGARTPFLRARNKPGPFHASDLSFQAGRALLYRQPFNASAFDQVILGCVMAGPHEVNIARIVALRLGCGDSVPAWTVQRNCASGLQALDCAAQDIASGRSELVLAGGTEAMSHAPLLFSTAMSAWLGAFSTARTTPDKLKAALAFRPAFLKPIIGLLCGLSDPIVGLNMGQTAEILAHRFNVSREEMDAFAVRSHKRLTKATQEGHLDEIETLYDGAGKFYDIDDGCRPDSSVEKLAKLRPAFERPFGKVTAANSAQITDGAAWLILASEDAVEKHKLPVLGQICDSQWAALDPTQMGLGPVHAMAPILERNNFDSDDIDYWEINEAFATQVQACLRAWQNDDYCNNELGLKRAFKPIDEERLNVDGGGVSLGHPVGASGARIVLHLLKTLQREGAQRGIASLCIGGGQGGAMLVERVA
ncbi:3-ketoacyl-CoA thiolase @ Acetyl-CoA acetyltransferase [hydrothermal vent metagenome]|uniref:3-ketoacyl-CoA thiolase @ Acetyl-CoA acetyltransferase n=1 Tax=hydrothermal vent metagenome TaxID=652676 RepID=A0A3B0YJY5_9ZZZZ